MVHNEDALEIIVLDDDDDGPNMTNYVAIYVLMILILTCWDCLASEFLRPDINNICELIIPLL